MPLTFAHEFVHLLMMNILAIVENLMTVVDRLDELQASSVGRREYSSIYGSEREPDAWTFM